MIGTLAMLLLMAGALGWVRLAPSDPERWHRFWIVENTAFTASTLTGPAFRALDSREKKLPELDRIIRATPRTQVLAGSVSDEHITYITRSAVFGFPDYTTVVEQDGRLLIYGRQRFGLSDFGVNIARIDGWLEILAQGG